MPYFTKLKFLICLLYGVVFNMKLCYNDKFWYDKKSKDPTYFVQIGIRNGKKTTTNNIVRIGKHSELLQDTCPPGFPPNNIRCLLRFPACIVRVPLIASRHLIVM